MARLALLVLLLLVPGCPRSTPTTGSGSSPSDSESNGSSTSEPESDGARDPETGSGTKEETASESGERVLLSAARIQMGSLEFDDEQPICDVRVSAFRMGRFEISNDRYARFLKAMKKPDAHKTCHPLEKKKWPKGKDHTPTHWGTEEYRKVSPTGDHPVVYVDWYDAHAFAAWAGGALPTEPQFERAAGWDAEKKTSIRYPWGNANPYARAMMANFHAKPYGDDGYEFTAPVDAIPQGQSAEGIYNLAGNVWEWCHGYYSQDLEPFRGRTDPVGPDEGTDRVIRGGGWDASPKEIRAANRQFLDPESRSPGVGIRVVYPR